MSTTFNDALDEAINAKDRPLVCALVLEEFSGVLLEQAGAIGWRHRAGFTEAARLLLKTARILRTGRWT